VSEPLRIGLLGRGTVGGALEALIAERGPAIEAACGRPFEISGVLTTSEGDFGQILASSDVIVELIGGVDDARRYVMAALEDGKPVVTANKQLVARYGDELFRAASANGTEIRFEAAVAGVVPIIRTIREAFGSVPFTRVFGIVNGTTNFILTEMASTGASYDDALARAQELGYAEADPTEDVNGADAAAKMAILARLAFHAPVTLDQVSFEGIESVQPDDLAYARELGLSLKLLGVAERLDEGITVRVFPCFLYPGHPLAPVEGPFNAVTIEGPEITEVTLSGPGAGGPQTAAAVLGDLISIVDGPDRAGPDEVPLPVLGDVESSFYLHLEVEDRPGVLAEVARLLSSAGVSVRSVVQKGMGEEARLVMVVHRCPEQDFLAAVDEIAGLDYMRAAPRFIRVIEEEFV
jgi:homoserine dehydrogenase